MNVNSSRRSSGFTLIELMVAMMIGLLVILAASAVFLANRRTYQATETVGRTQENARIAFELMSRDLREAGIGPCGNPVGTQSNALNGAGTHWYDGGMAVRGYGNGSAVGGAAGTNAIDIYSGNGASQPIIANDTAAKTFTLGGNNHGMRAGTLAMVCDTQRATILQLTSGGPTGAVIGYGGSANPGNATTNLGGCIEKNCNASQFGRWEFTQANAARIARLSSSRWFVRNGALVQLTSNGNAAGDEIVRNVNNLQLTYLLNSNPNWMRNRVVIPAAAYVDAAAVDAQGADAWNRVLAVRIILTLQGDEAIDGRALTRTVTHTVALRNMNI